MAARLKERYEREIKPQLMERFRYKSSMQVPRVEKITLNMGVGEAKVNTALLDAAADQLSVIAGQRPVIRRARKSIASFKLREGMPVGAKVTLRGERMYEMLDRLQSVAIPRIRDFRGLNPKSFDGRGNYSLGIREQIIFPEIDYDRIDQVRGLDVTITTSATSDDEAYELLRLLGLPFRADGDASRPQRAGAPEAAAAADAASNGAAADVQAEDGAPDASADSEDSAPDASAEDSAPDASRDDAATETGGDSDRAAADEESTEPASDGEVEAPAEELGARAGEEAAAEAPGEDRAPASEDGSGGEPDSTENQSEER
jgi:large subunit ribosomal protein L5